MRGSSAPTRAPCEATPLTEVRALAARDAKVQLARSVQRPLLTAGASALSEARSREEVVLAAAAAGARECAKFLCRRALDLCAPPPAAALA